MARATKLISDKEILLPTKKVICNTIVGAKTGDCKPNNLIFKMTLRTHNVKDVTIWKKVLNIISVSDRPICGGEISV